MRLLLVGPEREENLSLRYLSASLLAAGHDATIVAFDSLEDLPKVLERARGVDAVGLSLYAFPLAGSMESYAKLLRMQTLAISLSGPVPLGRHPCSVGEREQIWRSRMHCEPTH